MFDTGLKIFLSINVPRYQIEAGNQIGNPCIDMSENRRKRTIDKMLCVYIDLSYTCSKTWIYCSVVLSLDYSIDSLQAKYSTRMVLD